MYGEEIEPEETIFDGRPATIGSLRRLFFAIATLGIAAIYYWIETVTTHYLITTQRIVVERGLFSKVTDVLEIYAIDDIELEKPFSQRLLGTGNMLLLTQDKTNPRLYLARLPLDVRSLYEQLRPAIEKAKYRQRIRSREG